jgi:aspartate racemase
MGRDNMKQQMKTLGIIGGISPESTIEYYRFIVASYREKKHDGSFPAMIINSINMKKMRDLIEANDLPSLTDSLLGEIRKLAQAGADFGLLAANTPHIVFDEVQRQSPIPLLSIVEATCDAAKTLGLKRAGLIGTRFTMQGRFYPEIFSRQGIALVVPDLSDQDIIHDKYMSELIYGVFLPETREKFLAIVDRLKDREGIEGLILGGTELPLILRDAAGRGIPFLDTTRIHAERAVARMLS